VNSCLNECYEEEKRRGGWKWGREVVGVDGALGKLRASPSS